MLVALSSAAVCALTSALLIKGRDDLSAEHAHACTFLLSLYRLYTASTVRCRVH